jgi:hypothetical protein
MGIEPASPASAAGFKPGWPHELQNKSAEENQTRNFQHSSQMLYHWIKHALDS